MGIFLGIGALMLLGTVILRWPEQVAGCAVIVGAVIAIGGAVFLFLLLRTAFHGTA